MFAGDQEVAEEEAITWYQGRGELVDGGTLDDSHIRYIPNDRSEYYYDNEQNKNVIVLHFTIGYLGGDLSHLTRNKMHVSVPYVIARNGTVFELHSPSYWSYHLGPNAVGGNELGSRRSIGIELSNIGPLEKAGNWLWNYYGERYCRIEDTEYYTSLTDPYRGYSYFATFTDQQYNSFSSLLRSINAAYGIPLELLPESKRFELFDNASEAKVYEGICSHVNFRGKTEKVDIGPAFEWQKIMLIPT